MTITDKKLLKIENGIDDRFKGVGKALAGALGKLEEIEKRLKINEGAVHAVISSIDFLLTDDVSCSYDEKLNNQLQLSSSIGENEEREPYRIPVLGIDFSTGKVEKK